MSDTVTPAGVWATLRARPGAVRDGTSVGLAVGVSGVAFGAAAAGAGLDLAQASVLSVVGLTGASQLAFVGAAGGGGTLVAAVVGALLLGTRNTLYGLRLSELLVLRGPLRRLVAAHFVIDETTAMTVAQTDLAARRAAFVATGVSTFVSWNAFTVLGVIGVQRLGDPVGLGLDALAPAVFLALLWPRLVGSEAPTTVRRTALVAAVIALAATPLLPPGVPVLLAAAAALVEAVRR